MTRDEEIKRIATNNTRIVRNISALLALAREGVDCASSLRRSINGSIYDEYIGEVLKDVGNHVAEANRQLVDIRWEGDDDIPF